MQAESRGMENFSLSCQKAHIPALLSWKLYVACIKRGPLPTKYYNVGAPQ